jgi:hypothetical protein
MRAVGVEVRPLAPYFRGPSTTSAQKTTLDPVYLGYVVHRAQDDSTRWQDGCHPR